MTHTNDDDRTDAGSVFIGGSVRGGAFSTGAGSDARTSAPASRNDVPPRPDRQVAPWPAPVGDHSAGSVVIGGDAEGLSIATGDNSTARTDVTPEDERFQELLEQIRLLRGQLPLLADTSEVTVVETELAEAELAITQSGIADQGLLRRLWERLSPGNTALGALASAVTLADMARRLLT
ncbi:hypothetical protein [Nocardiopsis sp. JB363]|uniref:hypothetical protein n=1 Tax=Nocardiopsis sp. JB363 TaxID=1434837 RepID=UPI00097A218E|nr:hypothetical protein [Nocardiopsis sp. JB363]SIO87813.1 hypothetical protein BQ8420_17485 [Nocardiopsis sp. JB363]